jgi:hypothetical protein
VVLQKNKTNYYLREEKINQINKIRVKKGNITEQRNANTC